MPAPRRRWTRADVLALPDDGRRYELVDGALLVTPAPRLRHQLLVQDLYDRVAPYAAREGVGRAFCVAADLAYGRDERMQPDLFVLPPWVDPSAEWDGMPVPLLVAEVVSPGSRQSDRALRRRRYLEAGVAECWILDLVTRTVERWRAGWPAPEVLTSELRWQPAGAVSMLVLDVVELLA